MKERHSIQYRLESAHDIGDKGLGLQKLEQYCYAAQKGALNIKAIQTYYIKNYEHVTDEYIRNLFTQHNTIIVRSSFYQEDEPGNAGRAQSIIVTDQSLMKDVMQHIVASYPLLI